MEFKELGRRSLGRPLGCQLAAAVLAGLQACRLPEEDVWLVPVPARSAAVRRRGFDPTSLLAARAAAQLRSQGVAAHRLTALGTVDASDSHTETLAIRDGAHLDARARTRVLDSSASLRASGGTVEDFSQVTLAPDYQRGTSSISLRV